LAPPPPPPATISTSTLVTPTGTLNVAGPVAVYDVIVSDTRLLPAPDAGIINPVVFTVVFLKFAIYYSL
jgi:hypothetical protein